MEWKYSRSGQGAPQLGCFLMFDWNNLWLLAPCAYTTAIDLSCTLVSAAIVTTYIKVLVTIQQGSGGTYALTPWCLVYNALLLAKGILLANFLCMTMFTCWTAAVFLLDFANWLLLLAVGWIMTKICIRLIGSGGRSRVTNWTFWTNQSCSSFVEVILFTKCFDMVNLSSHDRYNYCAAHVVISVPKE